MTADGVGGPKDDVAARALFEKAAAQATPGQWSEWAHFRETGARGCPRDPRPAAKACYREIRSARQ